MQTQTSITLNVEAGLTSVVKMPRFSCPVRGQKAAFYNAGQHKKLVLFINNVVFNAGSEHEFKMNVLAERVLFDKRELVDLKKLLMDNTGQTFDVEIDIEPVIEGVNDAGHGVPLVGKQGSSAGRMLCKIRSIDWQKRDNAYSGIVAPPVLNQPQRRQVVGGLA